MPRQRIEQYFGNFGDWPTAFAAIKGIETRTAVSTFDPVLMIKLPLVVETSYYEYVDVFTDPSGTRVVQIDWGGYNKRETIFKDSNFESSSLARFDLKTPGIMTPLLHLDSAGFLRGGRNSIVRRAFAGPGLSKGLWLRKIP